MNKGGCFLVYVLPKRAPGVCVLIRRQFKSACEAYSEFGDPRLTYTCFRAPVRLRPPRLPAARDSALRTWRLVTASRAARFPALAIPPWGRVHRITIG